jgi:hypothetical protein
VITKEQREAAKAAIDATEPTDEDMRRITNVVEAFSALQAMPAKKLVNIALSHMPIMPIHYEQIVEELCTRVYPDWAKEAGEATQSDAAGDAK